MKLLQCSLVAAVLGSFAPLAFSQTDFTTQQYPSNYSLQAPNAHAADFNEDGFTDIVGFGSSTSTLGLSLALSTGSGSIGAQTPLPLSFQPSGIAISDFNGDGHLDIAALGTQSVALLNGRGDGTFAAPVIVPLPTGVYSALVSGDFDGNDTQDLAALDASGKLVLLLNNGKDVFTSKTIQLDTPPSGLTVDSLVVGDFNGDGRPDLAWVEDDPNNATPSTAWSALNTATGVFAAKKQVATLSFGLGKLLAADLDLDGKTDLVAWTAQLSEMCCSANPISLLYATADGSFTTVPLDDLSVNEVGVTDINGDGTPDILLTDYTGVTVYLGNGSRSFTGQGTFSLNGGASPFGIGFFDNTNRIGLATLTFSPVGESFATFLYALTNNNAQQACQYPSTAGVAFCSVTQSGSQMRVRGTARAQIQPVRRIELWANNTKLYEVASDEFDATLALPAGTPITATEVEANGATRSTVSGQATACAVPTSPGVNLCAPGAGKTVSSPVNIVATGANATGGVDHLELWIDGNKVNNYTGATMNASIPLASGSHVVTVVEVDTKGVFLKSSPVTFEVGVAGSCSPPSVPGVNLCTPTSGETASSPVTFVAGGTGASGSVNHMELWIDGTKSGNYGAPIMDATVPVASGAHIATVVEVDSKGAFVKSAPLSFTVSQASACAAPTFVGVNVCSPTSSQVVGSPVNIVATGNGASGAVNHLELWIDNTKFANYTGASMNASVPIAVGGHSLAIVEVDSKGAFTKAFVGVTVK